MIWQLDKYFLNFQNMWGQAICRLAEEQTLSWNIVQTEHLGLKMMKASKTCHFINSGYFGKMCKCHFKIVEDWLFVSRLTTEEVSVEPTAGRIENVRDLTHGVGTKNVLARTNINSMAHLNLQWAYLMPGCGICKHLVQLRTFPSAWLQVLPVLLRTPEFIISCWHVALSIWRSIGQTK